MLIYQRVSLARNLPHILAKVYLDQLEHHILNTQPSHVLIIAGPETPVTVDGLICPSTSELLESFQLSYRTGAPARELIVLDLLQPPQKKNTTYSLWIPQMVYFPLGTSKHHHPFAQRSEMHRSIVRYGPKRELSWRFNRFNHQKWWHIGIW
jgi:hypothetical protein